MFANLRISNLENIGNMCSKVFEKLESIWGILQLCSLKCLNVDFSNFELACSNLKLACSKMAPVCSNLELATGWSEQFVCSAANHSLCI